MRAASHKPSGKSRAGGRPSLAQAKQLRAQILSHASALFLTHGYGGTSIEAVAKQAGISKRTFYSRFADKTELFGAVIHRLIDQLRPPATMPLFEGTSCEAILQQLAVIILRAALQPEALALHRILTSEAHRFPELGPIIETHGGRAEAVTGIADVLMTFRPSAEITRDDAIFAAQQFLHLVMAGPQHRALGMGTPLTAEELKKWANDSVRLFLHGWTALGSGGK